ncbi:MAG: glutathione S-transferase [Alphaproteobacteria bacterium]|jgi:glutathione S-transferase|uniref:glutathione transferase n=1 Tax=Brevundimonas mediterranea TaxID=74329 RepID=A0A7Z8Y6G3_9CAUL|nr:MULTISPECIES: glutathione S-transferase [Brevundimonas]MBU1272368.1 glutathione S-transferase [Alphaproteobacteria bacterium]OGN41486.1 MAG: glutathione S-transferase [Caulobacterales bacterium GWE1_67_11]KDP92786.1 glutathione S-transferase [Brevundimonas sp. EAKA]MBJ7319706.1 glutathione S-transferase [Brevundimonas sp.]MBU1522611.1 glutathione S-transferase [Alphaproteobacteria bacterium]
MIKVHHLNDSRSQRVLWLLEELGLDYEVVRYERDATSRLAPPELLAIHPLGKSPVIQDDGVTVAETGAVVEYLLDTYGEGRLRPAAGSEDARRFTYWLHYAEGSAMPPLLLKLVFSMLPRRAPGLVRPLVKSIAAKALTGFVDPQLRTHVGFWEDELGRSEWFAGDQFTAADIMMSFPVEAGADRAFDPATKPRLRAFLDKIHARPAYRRALERGGAYSYA